MVLHAEEQFEKRREEVVKEQQARQRAILYNHLAGLPRGSYRKGIVKKVVTFPGIYKQPDGDAA